MDMPVTTSDLAATLERLRATGRAGAQLRQPRDHALGALGGTA